MWALPLPPFSPLPHPPPLPHRCLKAALIPSASSHGCDISSVKADTKTELTGNLFSDSVGPELLRRDVSEVGGYPTLLVIPAESVFALKSKQDL